MLCFVLLTKLHVKSDNENYNNYNKVELGHIMKQSKSSMPGHNCCVAVPWCAPRTGGRTAVGCRPAHPGRRPPPRTAGCPRPHGPAPACMQTVSPLYTASVGTRHHMLYGN